VFAEKGDAAKLGAHLVVQILGDAGAFAFEKSLMFEALEPPLQLSFFGDTCAAAYKSDQAGGDEAKKPPRLPEMRQHNQGETGGVGGPNPVAIARADSKLVVARRDEIIEGGAARSGIDPIAVESFELVAKTHAFGSIKADSGVGDLEAMAARGDAQGRRAGLE